VLGGDGRAGGDGCWLLDLGEQLLPDLSRREHVFQVAAPGPGLGVPAAAFGRRDARELAAAAHRIVGRSGEARDLSEALGRAQLVTVTGVGGVGKTRLAIQAAAGLAPEFPDGVWLAELAPLIDSALVASAVASAVGASVAGGLDSTEVVCRFLGQRRALVVLDNCEHVIDAAAALVDRLLAAAPRVRVLATSREALDVAGESAWRVPSMSLADNGEGDALALFADRASQVHPDLRLSDPATREAAVAVCRAPGWNPAGHRTGRRSSQGALGGSDRRPSG
jgi:hypothetical protein